ncbi:hypothetical protein CDAR_430391 [Caerostris darwini]|uniref:Uncharacterized protein n=1 Tax=Caerostris darwini TaxID=1538125 RepID=A0AAV4UTR3_9ARAC|nr:hypothetical protein CDAR_430391 [Caerostris darwini]
MLQFRNDGPFDMGLLAIRTMVWLAHCIHMVLRSSSSRDREGHPELENYKQGQSISGIDMRSFGLALLVGSLISETLSPFHLCFEIYNKNCEVL